MFELFENDNYICEENIKLVTGFICAIAKKVEAIFEDELVKFFGDKADKTCICSLV